MFLVILIRFCRLLRVFSISTYLMFYKKLENTGVCLLDFFCSGIQFYLLLSPYLCFISLLYLDLYVLGDDALISKESFMQTK